jgi:circadian clock protein KaiB
MNAAEPIALVLFVSDDSPRSIVATANIQQALEAGTGSDFALEIVNVFAEPDRALAARVLVTPTLLAPAAARRLVGDLSEHEKLRYFLHGLQIADVPPGDDPA